MAIVSFAKKPTSSLGKDDITIWIKKNCRFYPKGHKSLILIGNDEGAPRHFNDELEKGFPPEDVIVAEIDQATANQLTRFVQTHRRFKGATIVNEDIVKVFDSYPVGLISHVDFDTAGGYKASIDSTYHFMSKRVPTIVWTITLRASSVKKVHPESEGGWEWRKSGGKLQHMPPYVKHVVQKLLENSPHGKFYDITHEQYTGVGSGNGKPGGTQMVTFALNLKKIPS